MAAAQPGQQLQQQPHGGGGGGLCVGDAWPAAMGGLPLPPLPLLAPAPAADPAALWEGPAAEGDSGQWSWDSFGEGLALLCKDLS